MKLNKRNVYKGNFDKKLLKGIVAFSIVGTMVFGFSNCGWSASVNGVISKNDVVSFEDIVNLYLIEIETAEGKEFLLAQYTDNIFGKALYDVEKREKIVNISDDKTFNEIFEERGELLTLEGMSKYFDSYSSIKSNYTYEEIMDVFEKTKEHYEDTREENVSKNIKKKNKHINYKSFY